ncbi:tetratricopeptide repeat-containing sensor histidine kinase [Sinomicrobium sp. M5D2P9]
MKEYLHTLYKLLPIRRISVVFFLTFFCLSVNAGSIPGFSPTWQENVDNTYILDSLFRSGAGFMQKREPEAAEQQYTKGLSMAHKYGDSLYTGRFYNGLGSVLQVRKEYDKALDHYQKGLGYLDKNRHPSDIGKVYVNLGALYAQLKDFDEAEKYLESALGILDEENVLRLHVMGNLAALYLDRDKRDASEGMILKAIPLAEKFGEEYVRSVLYTNLSNIHTEKEQWEKAISAGELALRIKDSLSVGSPAATYNNLGRAYEMSGRYDRAGTYYRRALEQATGEDRVLVLQNLKSVAKKQEDFPKALEYAEERDKLRDSLQKLDYRGKVAELTEKYESEQKQARIDFLQAEGRLQEKLIARQRVLVGISLALLVLFAVLVYIWLKQTRIRQALEKSRMQQRFLLAQLNPHFIFNALQSVQNFIFKNETEASMTYLNSFGRLIRSVLESSDRDTIALEKEVEMIRNFLQLQQLNHQDDFTYEITPDELPEDMGDLNIPVMLVQPFVENAVIHGMRDVPQGRISVDLVKEENSLKITICDNGKGLYPQNKQKANALHRSMGSEIVNKRINEFNKVNKRKISLEILPFREHPEFPGTRVILYLPVLEG